MGRARCTCLLYLRTPCQISAAPTVRARSTTTIHLGEAEEGGQAGEGGSTRKSRFALRCGDSCGPLLLFAGMPEAKAPRCRCSPVGRIRGSRVSHWGKSKWVSSSATRLLLAGKPSGRHGLIILEPQGPHYSTVSLLCFYSPARFC